MKNILIQGNKLTIRTHTIFDSLSSENKTDQFGIRLSKIISRQTPTSIISRDKERKWEKINPRDYCSPNLNKNSISKISFPISIVKKQDFFNLAENDYDATKFIKASNVDKFEENNPDESNVKKTKIFAIDSKNKQLEKLERLDKIESKIFLKRTSFQDSQNDEINKLFETLSYNDVEENKKYEKNKISQNFKKDEEKLQTPNTLIDENFDEIYLNSADLISENQALYEKNQIISILEASIEDVVSLTLSQKINAKLNEIESETTKETNDI